MRLSISKSPTWILFVASIIPFIVIYQNPIIWSSTGIFLTLLFSLWTYSVVNKIVAKQKSLFNITKFNILLLLSGLYLIFLSIYVVNTLNKDIKPKWMLLVLVIGNLFLSYSYFYIINFFSKALSTAESQRITSFSEYAFNFICFIFFPIGIWSLNPRIKSII